MLFKKLSTLAMSLAFLFLLAACDTAEERAEKHFQQGSELIEQGDVDRGLVELRNVFKLNGAHKKARLLYARTVFEQGNITEAYGQYLRHVEFYPNELDGRLELAEMALTAMNWPEVERHSKVAQELAPDSLRVQVVVNGLNFRNALQNKDIQAERAAIKEAHRLKDVSPESLSPRHVIIEGYLRSGDTRAALGAIDDALVLSPKDFRFHQIKLSLLNQLGETVALEDQLKLMIETFPENNDVKATLLRWYISNKEMDKAEAFLRTTAEQSGDAGKAGKADLIRFLISVKGRDVARAEIDRILADGEHEGFFRALRASLDFDDGNADKAIAELEDYLSTATDSEETRTIKVTLARMRWTTGNLVGARELVEEVLAADSTQLGAMKLKAGWLIDDDKTNDAILLLRNALAESPQDSQLMTLMARAYERDGSRDLVGEMLSRAVETSNNAPQESLLYARFLMADDKDLPAESILISALRLSPNNLQILEMLGDIYIKIKDIPRAQQILDTLERQETAQAKAMARSLTLKLLDAQDRGEEVIELLEGLAQGGEADLAARLALARTHLVSKKPEEAMRVAEEALLEYPDSPVFLALKARLVENQGDSDQAISIYRGLLQRNDQAEGVWRELYAALRRAGKLDEADTLLDQGLAAMPNSGTLKWIKASSLEAKDDVPGAIEIYEQLYAINSSNMIVANNLASLIANYTDDPEELQRAYVIARRLRGATQPHFQDTYGWIAYRRGDYDEALSHLEPAADGRLRDATTNYHLGMLYLALKRPDDATVQFRKTLELARADDLRPEIQAAKDELKKLAAELSAD